MSSTSVAARQLGRAALGARVGRRLLHRDVAVRALPERQLVAPPDLARDVPVGRVLERRDREAVLRLGMVTDAARRGAPRAPAASAPPSSTTTAARSAARSASCSGRTARRCAGTTRASRAGRARAATRGCARPPPPASGRRARPPPRSSARRGRSRSARAGSWSRPISKSVGSWPGVIFSAPVPKLQLDALVGDHRHAPLDERHDHLAPDQRPCSGRRPDAPRPRRRRGSSPAAPSRS